MGKLKTLLIGALSVACAVLSGTSTPAGEFVKGAVLFSAGIADVGAVKNESGSVSETSAVVSESSNSDETNVSSAPSETSELSESDETSELSESDETSEFSKSVETSEISKSDETSEPSTSSETNVSETTSKASETSEASKHAETPKLGKIITKNRADGTDDEDYSKYTEKSGRIERYNFGYFDDPNIVTLSSGAQIRNCTDEENADLLAESEILPVLGSFKDFELGSAEPQVLIYHTHTSESFLPYGDDYDENYPIRSSDPERNMTAVGDAICEALAKRGISSVHDCKVHDYPMFTGAYYRSADTMTEDLEEYPSIKIAIDIHRDGIINEDSSVTAPIAEISGKTAAQFMIITGCDGEDVELPGYKQNLELSCLIQNCAETAYPTLARPILFDYRNYNQSLFAGDILIEVGSQGNTLDEAVYTGELLGNVIADAVIKMWKNT